MNDKETVPYKSIRPDPLALAVVISQNVRMDQQLKHGAKMMLYHYASGDETMDEAIAKEIGLKLETWRKWRLRPEFVAYCEQLIDHIYKEYTTRGILIQELISQMVLKEVQRIKKDHDEKDKRIPLKELGTLITKFKKADPGLILQQQIVSSGDTKITNIAASKGKIGSVTDQLDALDAHIKRLRVEQAKIHEVEAEVVEGEES